MAYHLVTIIGYCDYFAKVVTIFIFLLWHVHIWMSEKNENKMTLCQTHENHYSTLQVRRRAVRRMTSQASGV